MNAQPVMLNLGCGRRLHPSWRNLDLIPGLAGVEQWSALDPIPAADGAVDACYSSHMLEHLPPAWASAFVAECFRVLKPGGVLRLVVPDLEGIAKNYLQALESGDPARHTWAVIEMLDQMTREHSGGAAAEFVRSADETTRGIIRSRWGAEAAALESQPAGGPPAPNPLRKLLAGVRDWAATRLARVDLATLRAAQFRSRGEVHRWMYDRISLARVMESHGFAQPTAVAADGGRIPRWGEFHLDGDASGIPHKPDSLFMEAVKPEAQS